MRLISAAVPAENSQWRAEFQLCLSGRGGYDISVNAPIRSADYSVRHQHAGYELIGTIGPRKRRICDAAYYYGHNYGLRWRRKTLQSHEPAANDFLTKLVDFAVPKDKSRHLLS